MPSSGVDTNDPADPNADATLVHRSQRAGLGLLEGAQKRVRDVEALQREELKRRLLPRSRRRQSVRGRAVGAAATSVLEGHGGLSAAGVGENGEGVGSVGGFQRAEVTGVTVRVSMMQA